MATGGEEHGARASALTRQVIARAARELFERDGYAATSVRAIAANAGIDPALVIRYFGSKERLFIEVMTIAGQPGRDIEGPLDALGARLASFVLNPGYVSVRRSYAALVRASDSSAVRKSLSEAAAELFVNRLADRLPGRDAALRAQLISAQLGGVMLSWSALSDEWSSDASRERAIELLGAAIQALVDDPADAT
ncbi:MAG: TetR family transcriptional regulator [Actinomycetia bacterium]|nr:TetR family transcriptional regulator [Actinomycetes bacterium]